jgi:DnaK suppressor protein
LKPAATPAPVYYSSSVIRIKTNAKPKRRGRGKTANSGNHRAETERTPAATSQDPIQFPEETRRLPKTHLSAKELREFRTSLQAKRTELCGDVERLTKEAFHQAEEGGSERSAMPIHMADLGSDNWEQDFTLGLIDTERSLVTEIDAALNRIEKKTYGICLATHNKISLARLRAKPWAKYCIEHARAREEGRVS